MSDVEPVGLTVAEKFFGLILIIIGAVTSYITYADPPGAVVAPFSGIFFVAGLALLAIGLFIVLAKVE